MAPNQFDVAFGSSPFLVLVNFRSNSVIAWTSPERALVDALKSETEAAIEKYSEGIGHAALFFRHKPGGEIIGIGQTGEDHSQGPSLLLHGLGFTAITNMVFTDGSLNDFAFLDHKSQLAMDHRVHGKRGVKFGFVSFRLNQQQADNVQAYFDEYRARRAYTNYGFPVDPLKFEGGGCTSFANAVVMRANVSFPPRGAWARTVLIPYPLMGYDAARIAKTPQVRYDGPSLPNRTVSALKPLAYRHWASNTSTGYPFMLYDPELFYLASAFTRNRLLTDQGKPPMEIVDLVSGDGHVDAMREAVDTWVNTTDQPLDLVTLYGMQGVRVG